MLAGYVSVQFYNKSDCIFCICMEGAGETVCMYVDTTMPEIPRTFIMLLGNKQPESEFEQYPNLNNI